MVWVNPFSQTIAANKTILTLQITAHKAGKLSELIALDAGSALRSEAYDATGSAHPLALQWRNDFGTNDPKTVFNINPNPSRGKFELSMAANREEDLLVEVIDFQGRVLTKHTFHATVGNNTWPISLNSTAPGLYCLLINGESTGKIICRN